MNEYRLESSFRTSAPPPNFEDERTVQSARRVVPLEKINNKAQRRRRWFLGGAFAIAMTLGAASALLASYLKLRNVSVTPNEVSQVEVTPAPEPVAVADTAVPDPPFIEEEELAAPATLVEELPKKAPVKRKAIAKHDEQILEAPHADKTSEEEDLTRIRDSVLFDEWQERRARRVLRRERRRNERNHRDLSNLDEIFEGRRRP